MDGITQKEYKMIRLYRKNNNQNIPMYFFNKYKDDLTSLIYYKINQKFSSVPFEKGDLFYFVWNGIKLTLRRYKNKQNFNSVLFTNCYLLVIKEIKKFLSNGELVMNVSYSFDKYEEKIRRLVDKNRVDFINFDRKIILENLIDEACSQITNYTQETIKKVIYLKSLGYSKREISEQLHLTTYYIDDLLHSVEEIVKQREKL